MITKKFGIDFKSEGGALTLDPSEVSELNVESGVHTRTHPDGWVITGRVHEDYYTWVNTFVAYHEKYGIIAGDFEDEVVCTSEEGFQHFMASHEPSAWDYMDI